MRVLLSIIGSSFSHSMSWVRDPFRGPPDFHHWMSQRAAGSIPFLLSGTSQLTSHMYPAPPDTPGIGTSHSYESFTWRGNTKRASSGPIKACAPDSTCCGDRTGFG